MKRRNWFWLLVIIATVAVFVGYCSLDAVQTDSRPPEISISIEMPEVSVEDPKSALLQGLSARDDRDGDVTDSIVVEDITILDSTGTVSVRYAAFDEAGNVARAERKAVYTDYVRPRFTLKRPLVYFQRTGFDVLGDVGATDVFDGDIQHRVRATALGEEDVTETGTHVIQFQVTNSLGDTRTESFPVEVLAADIYDADMELKEYIIYLPVGASFDPVDYLDNFVYQRGYTTMAGTLPAGFDLETKGQVRTQEPGTYTVAYTLTYTERNENNPANSREYVAYSKLIVIVEG